MRKEPLAAVFLPGAPSCLSWGWGSHAAAYLRAVGSLAPSAGRLGSAVSATPACIYPPPTPRTALPFPAHLDDTYTR